MPEPICKTALNKNQQGKNQKIASEKDVKNNKKETKITSKEIEELQNEKTALEEKNKQLTERTKLVNMTGEEFHKLMECYVDFFKMAAIEKQTLVEENSILKEKVANLDTALNNELLKLTHAKEFIEKLIENENELRNKIDYQDKVLEKMKTKCDDLKYYGMLKASEINSKLNKGKERSQEVAKLKTKVIHNHAKINALANQINNNDKGYIFAPLRNSIAKS